MLTTSTSIQIQIMTVRQTRKNSSPIILAAPVTSNISRHFCIGEWTTGSTVQSTLSVYAKHLREWYGSRPLPIMHNGVSHMMMMASYGFKADRMGYHHNSNSPFTMGIIL